MAVGEEVGRLFATLGFKVETKNLEVFDKKLGEIETKLQKLRASTKEAIKLNVALSATSQKDITRAIRKAVKDASDTSKLTIKEIDISSEAVRRAFRANAKGMRLPISSVVLSKGLITKEVNELGKGITIKFTAASITAKALRDATKEASNSLELKIYKAWISKKGLQEALNIASSGLKLKLIEVTVDQNMLRQSLDAALAKYRGTIHPRVGSGGLGGQGGTAGHIRGAFGGGAIGGALSNAGGLLGGAAAAYGVGSLNKLNQELQSVELALGAVTSSEEEAAAKLKMLNDAGREMGKTLRDIGPMYTQILAATKGTAMESQTDSVFRGFMKYGTVMGLDSEAMKGSFRAISQMVSKQQVYAEELRGQLAERLPAAVRIAAEVTTGGDTKKLNKMMEAGELDPNELLPKMAAYMEKLAESNGAYAKSLETSRVAQGRLAWQFEQTVKIFAKAGFDEGMTRIFNTLQELLAENEDGIKSLGKTFNQFSILFRGVTEGVQIGVDKFYALTNSIGLSNEATTLLAGTAGLLLMPFTRLFTLFGLLALAVEDISKYTQGQGSLFGDWINSLNPKTAESLGNMTVALAGLAESLAKIAAISIEGWGELWKVFEESGGLAAAADLITDIANAITTLTNAIIQFKETGSIDIGGIKETVNSLIDSNPVTKYAIKDNPLMMGLRAASSGLDAASEDKQRKLAVAVPFKDRPPSPNNITFQIDFNNAQIDNQADAEKYAMEISQRVAKEISVMLRTAGANSPDEGG